MLQVQSTTPKSEPSESTSTAANSAGDELPGDPNEISLLTWNLDGLDDVSLITRTRAAIQIIKRDDPDIIFFQELVARSWDVIKNDLQVLYHTLPACTYSQYFTAVLLKKGTVLLDDHKVKPFHSSMMMRKLQIVHANVKGIDIKLMNTHLESTAAHSVERMRQFKICMEEIKNADRKCHAIFGGDLNLGARDQNGINLPPSTVDVWEALGSVAEKRYTWDVKYNDNKQMSGGGKPRCRFDRVYFRSADSQQITPSEFHLRGIERIKDCSRFPSDHWAILCKFHIKTE